jgi:hypothetical protein
VTKVVIKFDPTFSAIGSLAVPDSTARLFTVTDATAEEVVGVIRMLSTELATFAAYARVVEVNDGDKLVPLADSEDNAASKERGGVSCATADAVERSTEAKHAVHQSKAHVILRSGEE